MQKTAKNAPKKNSYAVQKHKKTALRRGFFRGRANSFTFCERLTGTKVRIFFKKAHNAENDEDSDQREERRDEHRRAHTDLLGGERESR